MKGCGDYGAAVQLYLDNELDGPELEEFQAHLEECETCRAELDAGEELSRLLHGARPLYSAPEALRRQVMQTTKQPSSSVLYASSSPRERIAKILLLPLQSASRGRPHWPVLIAAILLLAV